MAHHAHTNRVRTDITLPGKRREAQAPCPARRHLRRVDRRRHSADPGQVQGRYQPRVVIQPAYRLTNGTYGGGGALVDARIIRQVEEDGRSYGQIMVSWEDSEAGGDYDMDVWGLISYEMDNAHQQDPGHHRRDLRRDRESAGLRLRDQRHGPRRPAFPQRHPELLLHRPDAGHGRHRQPQLNASGGCRSCNSGDTPDRRPNTRSPPRPGQVAGRPALLRLALRRLRGHQRRQAADAGGIVGGVDPAVGVRQAQQLQRHRHARRHPRQLLQGRQPARARARPRAHLPADLGAVVAVVAAGLVDPDRLRQLGLPGEVQQRRLVRQPRVAADHHRRRHRRGAVERRSASLNAGTRRPCQSRDLHDAARTRALPIPFRYAQPRAGPAGGARQAAGGHDRQPRRCSGSTTCAATARRRAWARRSSGAGSRPCSATSSTRAPPTSASPPPASAAPPTCRSSRPIRAARR